MTYVVTFIEALYILVQVLGKRKGKSLKLWECHLHKLDY